MYFKLIGERFLRFSNPIPQPEYKITRFDGLSLMDWGWRTNFSKKKFELCSKDHSFLSIIFPKSYYLSLQTGEFFESNSVVHNRKEILKFTGMEISSIPFNRNQKAYNL